MKRLFQISAILCALSLCASGFFFLKNLERRRHMDTLIRQTVVEPGLVRRADIAVALSREIYARTSSGIPPERLSPYDRLESTSFFNVTSAVALKHGGFGILGHHVFGPCGTMSRAMLNALWRLGIPARKLQLLPDENGEGGGHTMIEFLDGDRWCVLSPSDSTFTWRNRNGSIATLEEIRDDPEVFAQIFERYPQYPYRFRNPAHIRWTKLPEPVRNTFRRWLGPERYAQATTPWLYDRPRELFFLVSLVSFGATGLTALGAGWSLRRRRVRT